MTEYQRLRAQAEETDARQQERTHEAITAEVERLRREIADYEQTDLVPRSRYDAVNADWLEAREQTKQLAHRAGKEIESLQSQLEQLRAENETLRSGIRKTLDENGHLADGENCTLIHLKRAIGEK